MQFNMHPDFCFLSRLDNHRQANAQGKRLVNYIRCVCSKKDWFNELGS